MRCSLIQFLDSIFMQYHLLCTQTEEEARPRSMDVGGVCLAIPCHEGCRLVQSPHANLTGVPENAVGHWILAPDFEDKVARQRFKLAYSKLVLGQVLSHGTTYPDKRGRGN